MKIDEYERGYRDASKAAITWLHERAREMNDPKARDILNSAAFGYGQELRRPKEKAGPKDPWLGIITGRDIALGSGPTTKFFDLSNPRILAVRLVEHLIVFHRAKGQRLRLIFNGRGATAWKAAGKMQKNGQRPISLSKLSILARSVPAAAQLPALRRNWAIGSNGKSCRPVAIVEFRSI